MEIKSKPTEFVIHPVEWTDEKVKRFWDFRTKNLNKGFFSKRYGKGIINLAFGSIKTREKILDYGCGQGHLLKYILEKESKKTEAYGFEFNKDSVEATNEMLTGFNNFKGCQMIQGDNENYTGFDDESFDVVFMIEVIEHLSDEYLDKTLREIHRILKKNGKIVITTPNNEDLLNHSHMCPDCGCVFHRMQHMRNFTNKSLSEVLEKYNYTTSSCDSTHYKLYEAPSLLRPLFRFGLGIFSKITRGNLLNQYLYFIGEKK